MAELWDLIGGAGRRELLSFSQANGGELLERHFASVRATRSRGGRRLSRRGVASHFVAVDDRPRAPRAARCRSSSEPFRATATARHLRRGEGRVIRAGGADPAQARRRGARRGGAGGARARLCARRRPGLPARRVLHGRVLPGPVELPRRSRSPTRWCAAATRSISAPRSAGASSTSTRRAASVTRRRSSSARSSRRAACRSGR